MRFPNFAALAQTATWYRKALTVDDQTRRAAPAILTGLAPDGTVRLPTAADHPNNIFTWLNGAYKINGVELITQLCPGDVCQSQKSDTVFDIAVVYLHTVLPHSLAAQFLPPIDAGWGNFGEGQAAAMTFRERVRHSRALGRSATLENFIESIDADNATFNFLHILLPHRRWEYTSSGRAYTAPTNLTGLQDDIWGADGAGTSTAFLRMLLQMGYLDTAMGKLRAHLEALGRFDETMIILVADHGIAFDAGEPIRAVTPSNASSILRVPLIIKYPGQTQGEVSGLDARTVDIVPTIADVLRTELPWPTTGRSLLYPQFPSRDALSVAGSQKRGPHEFRPSQIFNRKQLDWQIANLGSNIPLSATVARGPAPQIEGRPVRELSEGEMSDLVVEIDGRLKYRQVMLAQPPLYLRARLTNRDGTPAEFEPTVGVELNGKLVVTGRTVHQQNRGTMFETILPEAGFVEGANSISLYLVKGETIHPLNEAGNYRLVEDRDGLATIADGDRQFSRSPAFEGFVSYSAEGDTITLEGWGVDTRTNTPVEGVAVFEGDRLAFTTGLMRQSKRISERFGFSHDLPTNFRQMLPETMFNPNDLRVFIFSDGAARELSICKNRRGRWC